MFCVFKRGNLSISDYCHKVKGMADDLHALGETIAIPFLSFYKA
jgi:hypothetical protein